MKLRNKKTGEVRDFIINKDKIQTASAIDCWEYNSLAELNEEWEDYEEPKEFYYVTVDGYITRDNDTVTKDFADDLKSIGNYFETNEEALEAVEKLKAWKRLKDKGFEFTKIEFDKYTQKICFRFEPRDVYPYSKGTEEDLELLFGGEE